MTTGDATTSGSADSGTPEPTDAELLRAHVDGDPQAFNELFRRHRDRLWAVALRTISDREEAADALQDALLSAHRSAARFRGDSAVTTWLHRIVVNACLDRMRRRQAHPTVPLPDGSHSDDGGLAGPEPAAPVQDHDTALVVREALAALPAEQRAALVLVDVQGYPVIEAAEILGVAEGTIKSRCARGRARMALALGHLRTGSDEPPHAGSPARSGSPARPGAASRPPGANGLPQPDQPRAGPRAGRSRPGHGSDQPRTGGGSGHDDRSQVDNGLPHHGGGRSRPGLADDGARSGDEDSAEAKADSAGAALVSEKGMHAAPPLTGTDCAEGDDGHGRNREAAARVPSGSAAAEPQPPVPDRGDKR